MTFNNTNSALTNADELLHEPTNEPKWRESYYFNWVDLVNEISGFSTIGIVPNENRREFVFLLFLKERNEVYYKEPQLHHYEDNISTMLTEKNLSYKLIEPFKIWQIEYTSRKLKFNIKFETRFPTYTFGIDSSVSWHQHFEASGIVKGNLILKDNTNIKINGYGQRDKSWGYRDWHQFDKWYAGHFQFKTWSSTFRKDYFGNQIDLSGHISNKKNNITLSSLEIETINDKDKFNSPLTATYVITDKDDNSYRIKAERIKKDSFIRFVRNFQGGYTELFEQMVIMKDLDTGEIGSGMMEHLRTFRTEE
ncbi:MAG: hypothetical protein E3J52_04345 [Promethearchaeota archaeon]|nr:MAG: hypothetical protein E3J52_04345 [Candidatus Lokiarchaeota archaeon]